MTRKKKRDSRFGPRLAAVRTTRGLTQIRLAESTKTTQRSISYYKTDDGVPPSSIALVLAKILHVSPNELRGLEPAPKCLPLMALDADPETSFLWKRVQIVTRLPQKVQRAVITLIDYLDAVAPRRNGSQEV